MCLNLSNIPLVSIACISYNHAKYIREAIESFVMQKTSFTYEILIHDDASTDGTDRIIKEYELKYPDLIFPIYQKENQYSKGVRRILATFVFPKCRGKYIALCEGDDHWTDPHKLQKQVDYLEANEAYSMCFHEADVVNEAGFLRKFNGISEDRDFDLVDLTQSNFISTASTVFRKKNIEKLPAFFAQLLAGDWGLHFLNAQKGKIKYFKDCMSVYRQHEGGMWSSLSHKDMVIKGVELMKQLDKCFDYKYHLYFQKGIEKRMMMLNKDYVNIRISGYQKLKNIIKRIINK